MNGPLFPSYRGGGMADKTCHATTDSMMCRQTTQVWPVSGELVQPDLWSGSELPLMDWQETAAVIPPSSGKHKKKTLCGDSHQTVLSTSTYLPSALMTNQILARGQTTKDLSDRAMSGLVSIPKPRVAVEGKCLLKGNSVHPDASPTFQKTV